MAFGPGLRILATGPAALSTVLRFRAAVRQSQNSSQMRRNQGLPSLLPAGIAAATRSRHTAATGLRAGRRRETRLSLSIASSCNPRPPAANGPQSRAAARQSRALPRLPKGEAGDRSVSKVGRLEISGKEICLLATTSTVARSERSSIAQLLRFRSCTARRQSPGAVHCPIFLPPTSAARAPAPC